MTTTLPQPSPAHALPLEMRMQLWTGLVLAMLGEFLEDNTNNEVCGVARLFFF